MVSPVIKKFHIFIILLSLSQQVIATPRETVGKAVSYFGIPFITEVFLEGAKSSLPMLPGGAVVGAVLGLYSSNIRQATSQHSTKLFQSYLQQFQNWALTEKSQSLNSWETHLHKVGKDLNAKMGLTEIKVRQGVIRLKPIFDSLFSYAANKYNQGYEKEAYELIAYAIRLGVFMMPELSIASEAVTGSFKPLFLSRVQKSLSHETIAKNIVSAFLRVAPGMSDSPQMLATFKGYLGGMLGQKLDTHYYQSDTGHNGTLSEWIVPGVILGSALLPAIFDVAYKGKVGHEYADKIFKLGGRALCQPQIDLIVSKSLRQVQKLSVSETSVQLEVVLDAANHKYASLHAETSQYFGELTKKARANIIRPLAIVIALLIEIDQMCGDQDYCLREAPKRLASLLFHIRNMMPEFESDDPELVLAAKLLLKKLKGSGIQQAAVFKYLEPNDFYIRLLSHWGVQDESSALLQGSTDSSIEQSTFFMLLSYIPNEIRLPAVVGGVPLALARYLPRKLEPFFMPIWAADMSSELYRELRKYAIQGAEGSAQEYIQSIAQRTLHGSIAGKGQGREEANDYLMGYNKRLESRLSIEGQIGRADFERVLPLLKDLVRGAVNFLEAGDAEAGAETLAIMLEILFDVYPEIEHFSPVIIRALEKHISPVAIANFDNKSTRLCDSPSGRVDADAARKKHLFLTEMGLNMLVPENSDGLGRTLGERTSRALYSGMSWSIYLGGFAAMPAAILFNRRILTSDGLKSRTKIAGAFLGRVLTSFFSQQYFLTVMNPHKLQISSIPRKMMLAWASPMEKIEDRAAANKIDARFIKQSRKFRRYYRNTAKEARTNLTVMMKAVAPLLREVQELNLDGQQKEAVELLAYTVRFLKIEYPDVNPSEPFLSKIAKSLLRKVRLSKAEKENFNHEYLAAFGL